MFTEDVILITNFITSRFITFAATGSSIVDLRLIRRIRIQESSTIYIITSEIITILDEMIHGNFYIRCGKLEMERSRQVTRRPWTLHLFSIIISIVSLKSSRTNNNMVARKPVALKLEPPIKIGWRGDRNEDVYSLLSYRKPIHSGIIKNSWSISIFPRSWPLPTETRIDASSNSEHRVGNARSGGRGWGRFN